jgi:glycosyltransferase involved in cell wall biosynthesis
MTRATFIDVPVISFVIPALNEERNIGQTLRAIQRVMGDSYCHESIVVDHGSTDRTATIALEFGASVYRQNGGTIASLRNLGARQAKGDVLVFLDADVELTEAWRTRFPETLKILSEKPALVTGSHCNAPADGTWLERYWFRYFANERNASHIGTGHMVVVRSTFLAIDGFDEHLETGEDYEFCRRVVQSGGAVANDPALEVVHREFPKNLRRFVQREAWHGLGDLRSWKEFRQSKVAVAAAFFLMFHLALAFSPLLPYGAMYVAIATLGGIVGLLFASSLFKYAHSPWSVVLINAVIFYFYYVGRSTAFVTVLRRRLRRSEAHGRLAPVRNRRD